MQSTNFKEIQNIEIQNIDMENEIWTFCTV